MAVSLTWSPHSNIDDAFQFVSQFVVFVILLPFCIARDRSLAPAWLLLWTLLALSVGTIALGADADALAAAFRLTARAAGSEEAANPLALADAAAILTILSLALTAGDALRSRVLNGRIVQLAGFGAVALGLWVTFMASRGETVALLVCIAAYLGMRYGGRPLAVLGVAIACSLVIGAGVLFSYSVYYERIVAASPRFAADHMVDLGLFPRYELVSALLAQFWSDPMALLFGLGFRASEVLVGQYPHSTAIQVLCETGLVGVALSILAVGSTFALGAKALRATTSDRPLRVEVSVLLALLLYQLVVGQKKGSIVYHDTFMWLLCAAVGFESVLFRSGGSMHRLGAAKAPRRGYARVWRRGSFKESR